MKFANNVSFTTNSFAVMMIFCENEQMMKKKSLQQIVCSQKVVL